MILHTFISKALISQGVFLTTLFLYSSSPSNADFTLYLILKGVLFPSKKTCFVCFNESSLKMTKNAFYFTLKAFFILKVFKFLS